MSAQLLDGRETASRIYRELDEKIQDLKNRGTMPHLSVVLVGEDPASKIYVGHKQKACEKIGISSETILLNTDTPEKQLLNRIKILNNDKAVHGILVQMPLPSHISPDSIIEAIDPAKDVDGFHPVNRGRLAVGQDCFLPCTPAGIQQLLLRYGYSPEGKHVVVIGRSSIVGMPMAMMMFQKKKGANATVTICHTGSGDLKPYARQADILVAAVGRENVITADMVKPGAVVIDVGMNRVEDATKKRGYRLCGDVDFEKVKDIAAAITPVPGGVGPMTIAMLMSNTVKAAAAKR